MKNPFRRSGTSVTDAWEQLSSDKAVLVDVRNKHEWNGQHVPGAVHIPLASLDKRIPKLATDRPVLAICQSGSRSAQAVRLLQSHGIEASNVRGGMTAWQRARLPTNQ